MAGGVTLEVHAGQPTAAQMAEWSQYLASAVVRDLFGEIGFGESPDAWQRLMTQWWATNPFINESTTVAFVLRSDDDVVGFHGLIPIDYQRNADAVPSLLATTFVVDPEHRGHSMKIFRKVAKLASSNHIVDGSATPDMQKLLDATGWSWSPIAPKQMVAVRPRGIAGRLRWLALLASRKADPTPATMIPTGSRWITSLDQIVETPTRHDDVLRPPNDRRFLEWILSSGSTERCFTGLVDADGRLLAHAILSTKQADFGLLVLRAVDGGNDDGTISLTDLLSAAASDPKSAGLPAGAAVISWAEMADSATDEASAGRVYYRLPDALDGCDRELHSTESDDTYF